MKKNLDDRSINVIYSEGRRILFLQKCNVEEFICVERSDDEGFIISHQITSITTTVDQYYTIDCKRKLSNQTFREIMLIISGRIGHLVEFHLFENTNTLPPSLNLISL